MSQGLAPVGFRLKKANPTEIETYTSKPIPVRVNIRFVRVMAWSSFGLNGWVATGQDTDMQKLQEELQEEKIAELDQIQKYTRSQKFRTFKLQNAKITELNFFYRTQE